MVTNVIHARKLLDTARGLQYLHSLDMPHGDLRGVGCHVELYSTHPLCPATLQSADFVSTFRRRAFILMGPAMLV